MVNVTVNVKGTLPHELFNVPLEKYAYLNVQAVEYARCTYDNKKGCNIALLTSFLRDICQTHEEFAAMCLSTTAITRIVEESQLRKLFNDLTGPKIATGGVGLAILEIILSKSKDTKDTTDSAKQTDTPTS